MKFFLLIPLLFLLSCSGCKKENKNPEITIIGTWFSTDPILQFPITNINGKDKPAQFLKYEKDGLSHLKVTHPNGEEDYIIHWIGKTELVLIDSNKKHINFKRLD